MDDKLSLKGAWSYDVIRFKFLDPLKYNGTAERTSNFVHWLAI